MNLAQPGSRFAYAELGRELLRESLIVVGYENGTHCQVLLGPVTLMAILPRSRVADHAR